MRCASCGTDNPPSARFCGECGSALTLSCSSCGAAVPPAARFCLQCGSALGQPPQAAPSSAAPSSAAGTGTGPAQGGAPSEPIAERRLCSILFVDLVGFTPLSERKDAEEVREILSS